MAGFIESTNFMGSVLPKFMPIFKVGAYIFIVFIIIIIGVFIIINAKRRKWKIEIHEQKADGRIHTVGFDVLQEKKINMGKSTVYWLKKAKQEAIPPPDDCVDRFKGKEEVDYLRIARDYIPVTKSIDIDFHNKKIRDKAVNINDAIIKQIRETKTSYFNSDAVRNRFIFIPINKTLTTKMTFSPIDYDVSMMAMNEIHNADEFYQSKYEWWKKYGAIIVFALVIVFLIILAVLTFEYMKDVSNSIMNGVQQTSGMMQQIIDKMGGVKPPS